MEDERAVVTVFINLSMCEERSDEFEAYRDTLKLEIIDKNSP